jgi:uncharacterized protein (DUF362 family)
MRKITRREFLQSAALALGSAAAGPLLSACQPPANRITPLPAKPQRPPDTVRPDPTAVAGNPTPETGEALPTQIQAEPTQPTQPGIASLPDLAVARHGDPETLARRALAALGGMERFVRPGANVVIKPNICVAYNTYEYAATTNPWVVAALVRMSLEAGAASVRVMDFPFGGTAKEAYQRSGIAAEVAAAGGEMVSMPRLRFVTTSLPEGQDLREAEIFEDILNADVLINVPIAKHHSLARLTLGMKNLMGTVLDRTSIHHNMGQRLADLAGRIRPALTVVDAVRILTNHGPTGGSLDDVKQLDTLIASPDIVAADSYAAGLFGMRPDDLAYIQAGSAAGLGRSDLKNLRIEEIEVGG